jgi:hypothetical protein
LHRAATAAAGSLDDAVSPAPGAAPTKGEVSATTVGGYARLVFTLSEEIEAEVRVANGIVIIGFKRAVDVSVDRIAMQAAGYVNAARIDPDGTAVRLALNRKVTVNTMAAGEKFFVDLLPEGWVGLAPGLPQEVVDDLARRARNAEKKARAEQQVAQQRVVPPVRVRVGVQPTFTRYTFGLPALIAVSIERSDDKMTMTFEAPLRFDLGDVLAALPPVISGVETQARVDNALVQFEFVGKVDIRTFREDNNFMVDIQPSRARETETDHSGDLAAMASALAGKRPPASAPPPPPDKTVQPSPPAKAGAGAASRRDCRPGTRLQSAKGPPRRAPAQPEKAGRDGRLRRPQSLPRPCTPQPETVQASKACRDRGARKAGGEREPGAAGRRKSKSKRAHDHPGARGGRRQTGAASKSGRACQSRCTPPGRRGAHHVPVCPGNTGRHVPARRHDLARVRQRGTDRYQPDRRAVRPRHSQCRCLAFERRPSGPAQARSPEAHQRRHRQHLDRDHRRHDDRAKTLPAERRAWSLKTWGARVS